MNYDSQIIIRKLLFIKFLLVLRINSKKGLCKVCFLLTGTIVGADVSGSHEEASAAKMGTSTGNQTISHEFTKRSFSKVHNKN